MTKAAAGECIWSFGASSGLVTERCGNITVLYTAAFWPHTVWTPGTADDPSCQTQRGSFFFSLLLNYFSRRNKQRASRQLRYCFTTMRSLWPKKKVWVGFLQRFDGEDLSPRRMQPVVVKVDEWEECLGEGSAGFQDCSGKDCLKSKRFFSLRSRREGGRAGGKEGGRRRVSHSPVSVGGMTNIKQTIFQHVYLERDDDSIYVSHSLSRRVTLLLDGSIFL